MCIKWEKTTQKLVTVIVLFIEYSLNKQERFHPSAVKTCKANSRGN